MWPSFLSLVMKSLASAFNAAAIRMASNAFKAGCPALNLPGVQVGRSGQVGVGPSDLCGLLYKTAQEVLFPALRLSIFRVKWPI
jgi:hypothetical protein